MLYKSDDIYGLMSLIYGVAKSPSRTDEQYLSFCGGTENVILNAHLQTIVSSCHCQQGIEMSNKK